MRELKIVRNIRWNASSIWAFYSDESNYPEFVPGLASVVLESGDPSSAGVREYSFFLVNGTSQRMRIDVIRYEPPRVWESRWLQFGCLLEDRFELEAGDDGTVLRWSVVSRPEGLRGRLTEWLSWGQLARAWNTMFDGLKRVVEARAGDPGRRPLRELTCARCGAPVVVSHAQRPICVYCGQAYDQA
jgi:hypothetical protein